MTCLLVLTSCHCCFDKIDKSELLPLIFFGLSLPPACSCSCYSLPCVAFIPPTHNQAREIHLLKVKLILHQPVNVMASQLHDRKCPLFSRLSLTSLLHNPLKSRSRCADRSQCMCPDQVQAARS